MSVLQAVLLGFVQGLTEFLPVSSSGHLVVLRAVMGLPDVPLLFDVLLHVATLFAVLVFFRTRILAVFATLGRWAARRATPADLPNLRLSLAIVIATAVTAVVGLAVTQLDIRAHPRIISGLFIVTALILIASRFLRGRQDYDAIGVRHALITGTAQGLGVLPGISRSGITITAALTSGLSRERAGEFSFLLAVPAIVGALVLSLRDASGLAGTVSAASLALGFAAAFAVGLASLALLVRLIRSGQLFWFSLYLIPLGVSGILFL